MSYNSNEADSDGPLEFSSDPLVQVKNGDVAEAVADLKKSIGRYAGMDKRYYGKQPNVNE